MERIEWVDSGLAFASTWLDEATIKQRASEWDGKVVTVGQVIFEDEERIIMGLSRDTENDNWAGCFLIWKPSIIDRKALTA